MAQSGYTPLQLYYSATTTNVPLAANLAAGELAINTADGKLFYKSNAGVVTLLASATSASSGVIGPASSTDNALARFDLTTGKLIQNSVGILSDAGVLTGLTGITSSGSITLSSLTSGRVTYAGASGLLQDSANLTFNGTTLTANTIGAFTLGGTIAGGNNQINDIVIGASTARAGTFTTVNATEFAGALNGTVGATTPSTGAFTTLSASGITTLSVTNNSNSALNITQSGSSGYLNLGGKSSASLTPDLTISRTSSDYQTFAGPNIYFTDGTTTDDKIIQASGNKLQFIGFDGVGNDELMSIATNGDVVIPIGNLLVGTNTNSYGSKTVIFQSAGNILETVTNISSATQHCVFTNPNGVVGTIQTSGNSTSYNTSSDYRLKENIQPMVGALTRVASLKPVTYNWKSDGSDGQGFIAHELAEVVPQAVTGAKDAVDAKGKPQYQGIDTSFLVATLTAALQEAHGLIKDLQSRVDALEKK